MFDELQREIVERGAGGRVDAPDKPGHDGADETHAAASTVTLLAWLSPAFPVGGYAYSHGLEQAVEDGVVGDEATLADWLCCHSHHSRAGGRSPRRRTHCRRSISPANR